LHPLIKEKQITDKAPNKQTNQTHSLIIEREKKKENFKGKKQNPHL